MATKKKVKAARTIEFGLDTFGDIPKKENGELFSHAEAIRQVVDEAVLADELGIDIIGVGEHHRVHVPLDVL